MSVHKVRCIKRCFDSIRCCRYHLGETADIESTDPIAMYFDGWPAGTEVYCKVRGDLRKGIPAESSMRVVPGGRIVIEEPTTPETPAAPAAPVVPAHMEGEGLTCDLCGKGGWASSGSLAAHKIHCAKKIAAVLRG
jgi:hypothetical protein